MSALFCSGNRSDKISSMRFATIWFTLGGILVGFVIGFLVASSINRSEINQLRANVESAKRSSVSTSAPNDELSDEEIRDNVAQAWGWRFIDTARSKTIRMSFPRRSDYWIGLHNYRRRTMTLRLDLAMHGSISVM